MEGINLYTALGNAFSAGVSLVSLLYNIRDRRIGWSIAFAILTLLNIVCVILYINVL